MSRHFSIYRGFNMYKDKLKLWFHAAFIRAVKTFAQTYVALIGTGYIALGDVDWPFITSAACVAAILSIATSAAGLPEVDLEEEECTDEQR